MIFRRAALALLAALVVLAAPATASAAVYTVDSVLDEADEVPGTGGCKSAGGKCTLRAAIDESNFSTAVEDTILFAASPFDGSEAGVIFPTTALPSLTSTVDIISGSCPKGGGTFGPCAGILGPGGANVLTVAADDVSVSGLSIGNGPIGIMVEDSTGFSATANWIGLSITGTSSELTSAGILLGPNSNEATIGGESLPARNLFAYSGVGLDIEGADKAVVAGNWFGLETNGSEPAANGTNIEITNFKPLAGEEAKAENNVVGAAVSQGAHETTECDGGCNVISGATGSGVNLVGTTIQGEEPATGPTKIIGNYVGTDAVNIDVVETFAYKGNQFAGILAGGADDVTIGGAVAGEANYIAGGAFGVYAENGDDLAVIGNVIGITPTTGAALASPAEVGIFAFALTLGGPGAGALIDSNSVRMEGGAGIEHRFTGAEIVDNKLEGGANGILSRGDAEGSLIAGNLVQATEEVGIEVRNSDNEIVGNEVLGSEEAGIGVNPTAEIDVSGNLIGGDSAAEENVISNADAAAIEIFGIEESRNEIGRNRGSGNGSDFIWLRPFNGPEGDPNGVNSPDILVAAKTEASGSAEPGALVRVFRKESEDPGEIAGFVAEAVANGSGQWKATFPGLPEKTIIVATQSLDGGTSSLGENAITPPDPPPTCADTPSMCVKPDTPVPPAPQPQPGSTPDVIAPKVTIKKAPKAKSSSTMAKFKFVSDEAGSKFQCRLDKGKFKNCRSPKTYKKLKPGKHVFKVRAIDKAGNVGKAVKRKFTVLG
jgi:CSLREA domain-containing protein